jgi:NAD(P) transhydrogenase subunit alpha
LQAIATARRLGAVVTATDVRPATKEQVESVGAKFLAVEDEEF